MGVVLILAVILSATIANAVPVDPDAPGGMAGMCFDGPQCFILTTEGETWVLNGGWDHWELHAEALPVPIEDVVDWNGYYVLSNGGELFYCEAVTDPWLPTPPFPGGVVPTKNQSLGGVKGLYR